MTASSVDIQQTIQQQQRKRRRLWPWLLAGVLLLGGLYALEQRGTTTVRESDLWLATVKLGDIDAGIQGSGKLVSRAERLLIAPEGGIVRQIHVQPGQRLQPGQLLLELSNPQLQVKVEEARFHLQEQEMALEETRLSIARERAQWQEDLAQAREGLQLAEMEYQASQQLFRQKALSELAYQKSRLQREQKQRQIDSLRQRLEKQMEPVWQAREKLQRARVEQARHQLEQLRQRMQALELRADSAGTLLQLEEPIQVGASLNAGDTVARLADLQTMHALLKVPVQQTENLHPGQAAQLNSSQGALQGEVDNIAPQASNGLVDVWVRLHKPYPENLRPGMRVRGQLVSEQRWHGLYLPLSAHLRPDTRQTVLVLQGRELRERTIRTGPAMGSHLPVLEGLQAGERVVLSDTSGFPANRRILLLEKGHES